MNKRFEPVTVYEDSGVSHTYNDWIGSDRKALCGVVVKNEWHTDFAPPSCDNCKQELGKVAIAPPYDYPEK